MGTVCEVCGDIGFEHLMVCCSDCKGSSTHSYMENQKQSSDAYFGPRLRISTRSKAANGSRRRHESRFRSQRMNKIAKDMEKRKAYMLPNTRNRNDRSGVGVTSNAHVCSGKKACSSGKKDQDGNIVSPQANRIPPMDSRAEQSSDALQVKKNCLIPLVDIKSSNPSRVENVLPSKELENPNPLLPMDGSNTKLRYQKLSFFKTRTSHPIDAEVMAKLPHRAKNNDASMHEDDILASKSNGQTSHTRGQDTNVKRHTKENSETVASESLVPNEHDSSEYKARWDMNVKEIEVETRMFGNDLSRHQVCKKRKKEEEKLRTCDNDDSTSAVQQDNLTSRSIKRRRYIPSNEEDEDEFGACDKNLMGVDAGIGLTPQASILNNCVERQCDYCSKPINEPAWRHDGELDQLVNEVMKNDLVLRTIINEAEMLIFPSILLPKRYQMFQGKYYLWAVFKPREDKGGVPAEPLDGTGKQQIKK